MNLKHNSSQIQLISLSDCSVYLVTGFGGKLSRPVYLDPHPLEYQSNLNQHKEQVEGRFLIFQPKQMLWVLNRTISMRQFF